MDFLGIDGFQREEREKEIREGNQEKRASDFRIGFDGFGKVMDASTEKREPTEKRASQLRVGLDGFMNEKRIEAEERRAESKDRSLSILQNDDAAWDQQSTYVEPGFVGFLHSPRVVMYVSVTMIGWFAFGYDQGVISSLLVLPQFLEKFPMLQSGLWTGLMTSSIDLGAIVGSFLEGWMADRFSRKYTLSVSCIILTTGHIMQTAASSYAVLTVGRTITGLGMGM